MIKRKIAVVWRRGERIYAEGRRARRAGIVFCAIGLWLIAGGILAIVLVVRRLKT